MTVFGRQIKEKLEKLSGVLSRYWERNDAKDRIGRVMIQTKGVFHFGVLSMRNRRTSTWQLEMLDSV